MRKRNPGGSPSSGAPLARVIKEWGRWRDDSVGPGTKATQTYTINQWFRGLKVSDSYDMRKVDEGHIKKYVNTTEDVSRSTRSTRLAALRSLFKFAFAKRYLVAATDTDPTELQKVRMRGMAHVLKETKHRKPVTPAEYHNLMEDATGFTRYAIALGYWTGMRLSDICCLEWASYDEPDGLLAVWTMKRDTRVRLDLHDPLYGGGCVMKLLAERKDQQDMDADYAFPDEREDILAPDTRARLSVYMGRHFAAAGVEGKSFHCLRHSFATRLLAAGKTLEQIGVAIGHASTKTTAIYAHPAPAPVATVESVLAEL